MSWKNTWILVGCAAAMFAFIFLFERHLNPSGFVPPAKPLFSELKPTLATTVTLRRGNEFTMSLQRTNEAWRYNRPFTFPAAYYAVQNFLETLESIVPSTRIAPREILARKQTSADFGFDSPPITITLERGDERLEVRFGARTPAGDQLYVQVGTDPSIFVVGADLLDRVPRTANDWRNAALFDLGEETPERLEILHNGTGYELALNATNKLWRLTRPDHRADQNQVRELIRRIQMGRVVEFINDDPRVDGETYGLQAPEFEVTLAGSSTERKIQFGHSPTNNPGLVYARMLSHSNVVLVPRSTVEPLSMPYAELRERQILNFTPEMVDMVEVRADESFVLRRDGNGGWMAGTVTADPVFVLEWLRLLAQLEATDFVQDVVSDFKPYGLDPGQRQYTLRTTVTNAAGPTNVLIAQIAFGTNHTPGKAFARRFDEKSVYGISAFQFPRMPVAAWQFRDHRVWSFTTNQVVSMSVKQGSTTRQVVRRENGEWIPVKGWTTDINPFAMEEIARNLGELHATMWLARGENAPALYGIEAETTQFIVELGGDKARTLTIEFGGKAPTSLPYAVTSLDGQPYVFEFPWVLYAELQRYFHFTVPPPSN